MSRVKKVVVYSLFSSETRALQDLLASCAALVLATPTQPADREPVSTFLFFRKANPTDSPIRDPSSRNTGKPRVRILRYFYLMRVYGRRIPAACVYYTGRSAPLTTNEETNPS